jgi:hypothetical protein
VLPQLRRTTHQVDCNLHWSVRAVPSSQPYLHPLPFRPYQKISHLINRQVPGRRSVHGHEHVAREHVPVLRGCAAPGAPLYTDDLFGSILCVQRTSQLVPRSTASPRFASEVRSPFQTHHEHHEPQPDLPRRASRALRQPRTRSVRHVALLARRGLPRRSGEDPTTVLGVERCCLLLLERRLSDHTACLLVRNVRPRGGTSIRGPPWSAVVRRQPRHHDARRSSAYSLFAVQVPSCRLPPGSGETSRAHTHTHTPPVN